MRLLTDRTALIQAVDRLHDKGGFAVELGKCALLADQSNLKKLVDAFPEYFMQYEAKLRLIYNGRYNHLLEGQAGRDSRGEHGDNRQP
jgi:hypothetical protein